MRLSAFILPEIQNITAKDDMELDKMGERKQAVFAIIPDNDSTFNYIVGMLYTCAFQSLYYQADKVHQGALPVPVRMMMDEFCNVSLPDDFGKLQATMRSRNIMSTIVLQNISAAVRLSAFILPEIQNITAKDDMELDKMGERKQAVFAIIPDNDSTFNYIVGMLYTCAFQSLYYQADKVHQGALPVPVRMMMDEFCNVSLPDDFGKLQATMRSRNIMSTIVLQNISALKALFKDDWEGLIGNADTLLYLGGNEVSTFKYISELLGKETLDTRTRSVSKGRNGSGSVNYQQTGRELMTPDEVRALDNDRCILFIRGELPVMDRKYDILKHPDLKLTEDGGAAPYVHCPGLDYALEDFPLSTERWESIEIIE